MYHLPTVRIASPVTDENPHGYVVINETDLADHHELFDDSPAPPAPPAPKGKTKA